MPQTVLLAHLREHVHVFLTVALSAKTRILFALVNFAARQVRKPCLDGSRGHESENAVPSHRQANSLLLAFRIQRGNARLNADNIAVDQHNQHARHACLAKCRYFLREALPHELLTSAASALRLLDANLAWLPPRSDKEAPGESFVLVVFAEDDDPGSSTHSAQPLAIDSESFSGPLNRCCCGAPTVTAPDGSRRIKRPFSPPM